MTDDATKMKQERDLALAECERLRADAERWQRLGSLVRFGYFGVRYVEPDDVEHQIDDGQHMNEILDSPYWVEEAKSIDRAYAAIDARDAARAKP